MPCLQELSIRERPNSHFVTSATELGYDVVREEAGVATGHIHIDVGHAKITVEHILKLGHHLHLVEQDIVHRIVLYLRIDVGQQGVGVAQMCITARLQIHLYYMLVVYPLAAQIIAEKGEQKVALTRPTHASHHLDHTIALASYQTLQQGFPTHFHPQKLLHVTLL